MRRSDSEFKQEIYRRYKHYKKNRRNLIVLAAAPVLASLMIACGLIFLPQLNLWNDPPVAEQPDGTTLGHIDETRSPDTLLEPDPSNPFYSAWEELKQLSISRINVSTLPTPNDALARSHSDTADITQIVDLLRNAMQTAGRECRLDLADDTLIYNIDVLGSMNATGENGNLPVGTARLNFQLVDHYLREGTDGSWYEIGRAAAQALTDALLDKETPAHPEVPEVSADHPFYEALNLFRGFTCSTVNVSSMTADIPLSSYPSGQCSRSYHDRKDVNRFLAAIETALSGDAKAVDQDEVNSIDGIIHTFSLTGTRVGFEIYEVYLLNDRYLSFERPGGDDSYTWYEIDSDAADVLIDLCYDMLGAGERSPELDENPFIALFERAELKSIELTHDGGNVKVTDSALLNRLQNALTSLNCISVPESPTLANDRHTLRVTLSDGSLHEIELCSELYRIDGGYWYATDGLTAGVLQMLIDSVTMPLTALTEQGAMLQAYTAVYLSNGDNAAQFTVNDRDALSKLDTLLAELCENAALPDEETLKWLCAHEPWALALDGNGYYDVTLTADSEISIVVYQNYLRWNGVWWQLPQNECTELIDLLTTSSAHYHPFTNAVNLLLNKTLTLVIADTTPDRAAYDLSDSGDITAEMIALAQTAQAPVGQDYTALFNLPVHSITFYGSSDLDLYPAYNEATADLKYTFYLYGNKYLQFTDHAGDLTECYAIDSTRATALLERLYPYGIPSPEYDCQVSEAAMRALFEAGGTLQDLIALIGEPHRDVGSGLTILAWDLDDGRTLLVWVGGGLEESRDLPIDYYEFWESPLAGLVDLLNACDIDEISVRPSPCDQWEGATTHFTDRSTVAAIIDRLVSLTKFLSPGEIPIVAEDQATLNLLQNDYTTYTIRLSGNPRPATPDSDIPAVYLTQTVELLCIPDKGYYLRYEGDTTAISVDLSDWVMVNGSLAEDLLSLIDSN